MKTIRLIFALLCLLLPLTAQAQNIALSTNVAGYADFGTLNAEASMSVARQWRITAGVKYNHFMFKAGEDGHDLSNKKRLFAAGARFWPWHVYSGWWFAAKMQYQEYNRGGIVSQETVEGDRVGIGATFGYTYMLAKHLNLELGIGGWAGADFYTVYECPVCGLTVGGGRKAFILPNDIIVAISYIF